MSIEFPLENFTGDWFVETGTFHGDGVRRALRCGFRGVVSIEVFAPLVIENRRRFTAEIVAGRVTLHHGDSADVLGPIAAALTGTVTFWLDAHVQTMNGAGVGRETCPLVSELRQILAARPGGNDIILIDDLRLVESPHWGVDLAEMYRLLWRINPEFRLARLDGHVPGDVLACVPRGRERVA